MENLTARKAILKSIEHHKRMRDWAEKQEPNKIRWSKTMKEELGETLGSQDCALCQNYFTFGYPCPSCPLCKRYGRCGDDRENLYGYVCCTGTYKEFVEAENKFIPQLESLLVDYPETQEASNV